MNSPRSLLTLAPRAMPRLFVRERLLRVVPRSSTVYHHRDEFVSRYLAGFIASNRSVILGVTPLRLLAPDRARGRLIFRPMRSADMRRDLLNFRNAVWGAEEFCDSLRGDLWQRVSFMEFAKVYLVRLNRPVVTGFFGVRVASSIRRILLSLDER